LGTTGTPDGQGPVSWTVLPGAGWVESVEPAARGRVADRARRSGPSVGRDSVRTQLTDPIRAAGSGVMEPNRFLL